MLKLVLFDLDGTLLLTGGAGLKALNEVFAVRYRIQNAFEGISPAGKTDPLIVREIFRRHGLSDRDLTQELPILRDQYLSLLADYIGNSAATIMPGIVELLNCLAGLSQVQLGLLTGNFKRGAYIKLDHFNLSKFFPFGAFGSDNEDRNLLVPVAVQRASEHLGSPVMGGRNVVVIGDTDRDVTCGKVNGTITIAVATGGDSYENLKQCNPDRLFNDFSDYEQVCQTILDIK